MDITTLAAGLAGFLAPLLPPLATGAARAVEKAAEELGKEGWEQAKALWGRLRELLGADSAAVKRAAEAVGQDDAHTALREALKELLTAHPEFAPELHHLLARAEAAVRPEVHGGGNLLVRGNAATVAGDHAVAVGGSVSGSVINTGSGNRIGDED